MSSIKPAIQALLRRAGLYERLKGSCLYDLYWRLIDRSIVDAKTKEIEFYKTLLQGFRKRDLIFDIGANYGYKTAIFLGIGARVIAIDPDESNQQALKDKFLRHRLVEKPVVVVGKAVSDENTVCTMWIDEPGSAKNTLSQKWVDTLRSDEARFGHRLQFSQKKEVEAVTLEQLISVYGTPYFVKIDVEGFEPNVLRGLKRSLPYISFEVNLPEFKKEGLECIDILGRISADGKFNYAIDCRQGLVLDRWLTRQEFREVFNSLSEPSLEVYWRTVSEQSHKDQSEGHLSEQGVR